MARDGQRAAEFGVAAGPVAVDMRAVQARVQRIVREGRQGLLDWLAGVPGVTLIDGHARFTGPKQVAVGARTLGAERVFINVGARPSVPELPGVRAVRTLADTGLLDLDVLPERLVVVGGGYIGLEFAQAFRRFGAEVTIVEKGPRLIGREDPDVSEAVRSVIEAEGVRVRTDAECIGFRPAGSGVAVGVDCAEGPPEETASHVLVAMGRRPNTDDLGLEATGVRTDGRGTIRVDDRLATNVPGIWALGECNGRGAFTHTAYNDFEIVAANLLDGGERKVTDRLPAYALYTDPPLGRVGMNEAEARASGRRVLVGKRPMTRVSRAVEKGETLGFIKVLADADTREILGAAILGVEGDEAVHRPRPHVCRRPGRSDAPLGPYPPDRLRVDPHDLCADAAARSVTRAAVMSLKDPGSAIAGQTSEKASFSGAGIHMESVMESIWVFSGYRDGCGRDDPLQRHAAVGIEEVHVVQVGVEADCRADGGAAAALMRPMISGAPMRLKIRVSEPSGSAISTAMSSGTTPAPSRLSSVQVLVRSSGRRPRTTGLPACGGSVRARRRDRQARAAVGNDEKAVLRRHQPGRQEVHGRRADEAGDEAVGRPGVEIVGGADLLDPAVAQRHDAVGERHRLGLVVGDVEAGGVEGHVQALDLGAHLDAQLGVEVGERLVEEEQLGLAGDGAADGDALALAAARAPSACGRAGARSAGSPPSWRRPRAISARGVLRIFRPKPRFWRTDMCG